MSIELIDLQPAVADLVQLVRDGMRARPRQLPAWLLYDAEGSRLFSKICEQPEYGLTRTEIALLEDHADDIARTAGHGVVVEFGIGNARKVDPLLSTIQPPAFVALDISQSALEQSLTGLASSHPNTAMVGICCDHTRLKQLPQHPALEGQRRIGFFPGSSLGNFLRNDAVRVLRQFRQLLAGGPLLLGLDQPRDPTASKPPTTMPQACQQPSPAICSPGSTGICRERLILSALLTRRCGGVGATHRSGPGESLRAEH